MKADDNSGSGWAFEQIYGPIFTPRKDPVTIVQEAGWAPGPVWTGAENLASTGIRSLDRPARSQSLYVVKVVQLKSPFNVGHACCLWSIRKSVD
jgi:hypothetical protein